MKITPEDVADRIQTRLSRCMMHWRGGDPNVEVSGTPGTFGTITLTFPEINFSATWRIYVSAPEDLQHYREVVDQAVRDYDIIVNNLLYLRF